MKPDATFRHTCHAGGRGFESRRSRKEPCKSRLVLSVWTAVSRRLHRLFRCDTRKARKRPETGRPGVDFKPIQTPFKVDREDGVQLHEMAGGHGSSGGRRRMQEAPSRPPWNDGGTKVSEAGEPTRSTPRHAGPPERVRSRSSGSRSREGWCGTRLRPVQ